MHRLVKPLGDRSDDGVRGVEHALGAAQRVLEANDAHPVAVRELEVGDILRRRAARAPCGLIVIGCHGHLAVLGHDQFDEHHGSEREVRELVDEHMPVALAHARAHVWPSA